MKTVARLIAGTAVALCALTACDNDPVGPGTPAYTRIDGFTSASRMLRVDSIMVYDTFAVVFWWEKWSDTGVTAYQIEYGFDSTHLTNTLELRPYIHQVVLMDTIHPLVPDVHYYARFFRDYHAGTVRITPFNFITRPAGQ